MTFFDHLAELRMRMFRIIIALVLTGGLSLLFAPYLLKLLVKPYGALLMVIAPTESFAIYLRVGLTSGIILAMPYIIFEIWKFVKPALHPRERRLTYAVVPCATVMFLAGSAFA